MSQCDYPAHLNVSSSNFGRCNCFQGRTENSQNIDRFPCLRAICANAKRGETCDGHDNSDHGVDACQIADDLILCRLSAVLATVNATPRHATEASPRRVNESLQVESGKLAVIPGDASVILPALLPHQRELEVTGNVGRNSPVAQFLASVGVDEVEALDPANGGPSAGQCQFACVASALSQCLLTGPQLRAGFRPDLELRQLALHAISLNPELYRDFVTVPGSRTRSNAQDGGSSVNLASYLQRMSLSTCDGDAVTLQALCDTLKISVRVVKPVDASHYDHQNQKQRLCALEVRSPASVSMTSSDAHHNSIAASLDEDDVTSLCSSKSDDALALFPTGSEGHGCLDLQQVDCKPLNGRSRHAVPTKMQRLYVSQEIRPRRLARIDGRVRDIQQKTKGRLVWLSHIGDAHYRFLRPSDVRSMSHYMPTMKHGRRPWNRDEEMRARLSALTRRQSHESFHLQKDGYERTLGAWNALKVGTPSADYLRMLRTDLCLGNRPRCSICMEIFSEASRSETGHGMAPSSCNHEFCFRCLSTWATHVAASCPICHCEFSSFGNSYNCSELFKVLRRGKRPPITRGNINARFCLPIDEKMHLDDSSISSAEDFAMETSHAFDDASEVTPCRYGADFLLGDLSLSSDDDDETLLRSCLPHMDPSFFRTFWSLLSPLKYEGKSLDSTREKPSDSPAEEVIPCKTILDTASMRVIRSLLTPRKTKSTVFEDEIVMGDSIESLFVPSLKVCRHLTDRVRDALNSEATATHTRDNLEEEFRVEVGLLSRILLWYCTLGALRSDFDLDHSRSISWAASSLHALSRRFSLGTEDALRFLTKNGRKKPDLETAPPLKASTSKKKRPRQEKGEQKGGTRKNTRSTKVGSGHPKKRRAETGSVFREKPSTEETLAKNVVSARGAPDKAQTPGTKRIEAVLRAPGKRRIIPVSCANISRDQWSSRSYKM